MEDRIMMVHRSIKIIMKVHRRSFIWIDVLSYALLEIICEPFPLLAENLLLLRFKFTWNGKLKWFACTIQQFELRLSCVKWNQCPDGDSY